MSVTPAPPTPTKPYKAIAAFVLTFAGLIIQAISDKADTKITSTEWIIIVVGALVTAGTVYGITNPAKARNTNV